MKYIKHTIDGIKVFDKLPHPFKNYQNFPNEPAEVILIEGFYELTEPELQEGEEYGKIIIENGKAIYEVINIQEKVIQEALDAETLKYVQRQKDGVEAYAKISAEFRLAKLGGNISDEAHTAIETTLKPVRDEVLAGQWITALELLESIGDAVIGNDLYTKLHTQIFDYIQLNYEN